MPIFGGEQALTLGLNVLIRSGCDDCRFHSFPYKVRGIIRDEGGKYPTIEFKDKNDVWGYIGELVEESKDRGSQFNLVQDIYEQLPFFVCFNHILDQECQKDISKFLYCQETGVPPHKGDFGEQPKIWIEKYYIIKSSLEVYYKMQKDKK